MWVSYHHMLPVPLPFFTSPTPEHHNTKVDYYAKRKITLQPSAPASLTLHARQPRPRLLIRASQPLSAHSALANISISLPNLCLLPPRCGLGEGLMGKARLVESLQSMTSTLGMVLFVVWVLECAGSATFVGVGGIRSVSNVSFLAAKRSVAMGILVNVKALCNGCPENG